MSISGASPKGHRVVLFDIGQTLVRACPDIGEMFWRVSTELGYEVDRRYAVRLQPLVYEYYEAEYLKDGDFWCHQDRSVLIWLDMYALMCREAGLDDEIDRIPRLMYDRYLDARSWEVYGDVVPCLTRLKRRGCRLAAVSNWSNHLEGLLRDLGLLPYFDEVVASAAVGLRKPDPAIFKLALQRLGATPDSAVHVGDSYEADVCGALNADIEAVLLDREGKSRRPGCPTIASLRDL